MVRAWLWQRIAPIRTHVPSIGIGLLSRPKILLVSTEPFHSSLLCPLSRLTSIQGIKDPAKGAPNSWVGKLLERNVSATLRSISKIDEAGLANSLRTESFTTPI